MGLTRRGIYTPAPGWGVFTLQVVAASEMLAVFLLARPPVPLTGLASKASLLSELGSWPLYF